MTMTEAARKDPVRSERTQVVLIWGGGHEPNDLAIALRDMADYIEAHRLDRWDIDVIALHNYDGMWHVEMAVSNFVDEHKLRG